MNDPHIDAAPTSIRAYARRRCRHLHLAVNSPPETLSVRLLNAITKNRMKTPLIQYVCSNKSFINCISILSVISGVKYCATRVLDSPTHHRLSLSNFVNTYVLFVLSWLLKKSTYQYVYVREIRKFYFLPSKLIYILSFIICFLACLLRLKTCVTEN